MPQMKPMSWTFLFVMFLMTLSYYYTYLFYFMKNNPMTTKKNKSLLNLYKKQYKW